MKPKPAQPERLQSSLKKTKLFLFRVRPAYLRLLLILIISSVLIPAHARAPVPLIPKGKGDRCVEDTDFMRKNHMELLLHQRDETVHRGIRTKKHALKECISCHAVKGTDGKPVNARNPKHFCSQCHIYASVKIDCFDCHASKPRPAAGSSSLTLTPSNSE